MVQVYLIDDNGFYIGDSLVKDPELMITTPITTGFIKPKWNGTEWTEGATEEEIEAWKQANKIDICNEPTLQEQLLATQKMVLNLQEQIIDML